MSYMVVCLFPNGFSMGSAVGRAQPCDQQTDRQTTLRQDMPVNRPHLGSACCRYGLVKLEFHDADTDTDTDTDTDILARILADTPDERFPQVIPMARSTSRRHSRDDPRGDVSEEVRVGVSVRVGAVECQLNATYK